MAFNVSIDNKIALLTERINALNLEGYQHELNKKSAEALGNSEIIAQSIEAIAIIEAAITVHETELADLA